MLAHICTSYLTCYIISWAPNEFFLFACGAKELNKTICLIVSEEPLTGGGLLCLRFEIVFARFVFTMSTLTEGNALPRIK